MGDERSGAPPSSGAGDWEEVPDLAQSFLLVGSRTIPVLALHLGRERLADGYRFRPVHCVIPALATPLTWVGELTIYDLGTRRVIAAFIPLALYALAGDDREQHLDGRMVTGLATPPGAGSLN